MRYFIDCEFDGFRGPLISMALVREDGRSLYFTLPQVEFAQDEWVIANVLPILKSTPQTPYQLTPATAALAVAEFMDDDEGPHIVADWPDDLRHFCDLVVTGPGQMTHLPSFTLEVKRIDAYPTSLEGAVQHCAWWDALALRQKVLELEEAQGRPELGHDGSEDGRRPFKAGDVVTLCGGDVPLTVLRDSASLAEVGAGPEVAVAWMTEADEMNEAILPVAALVRVSA